MRRSVARTLTYAQRRAMLLIELRIMRLTKPSRRVVKHQQRLMRKLRSERAEGATQWPQGVYR